jgi:hypothetical protein
VIPATRREVADVATHLSRFEEFSFGKNGCFFDAEAASIALWGVIETEDFFRYLDTEFEAPIGRKLLYAATDAEEVLLQETRFPLPRFRRTRHLRVVLRNRATRMGWGRFETGSILNPCHDALSVGFSLAHEEHVGKQRLNIEWRQLQPEFIRYEVTPKATPTPPASKPRAPEWGRCEAERSIEQLVDLELEERANGFFLGEQRSFFMPTLLLDFLQDALRGRPLSKNAADPWLTFTDAGTEHRLFAVFARAARSMFENSTYGVYVLEKKDWEAHVQQRIQRRGLGRVEVLEAHLEESRRTVFRIQSCHPAVVCGVLVGMWERCYGLRCAARVDVGTNFVDLFLGQPAVEYA